MHLGKNNRKGKRKQTSARAAREKVQFSGRKKSSNGGVSYIDQYDTDSSLSDTASKQHSAIYLFRAFVQTSGITHTCISLSGTCTHINKFNNV